MRFHKNIEGELCKTCVHKNFWKMTLTTLLLGWWSVVSLIVTPVFLVLNLMNYGRCIGMPAVPPMAKQPKLTEQVLGVLQPHSQKILAQLKAGDSFKKVATDIAYMSGVTPGEALLYINELVR